MPPAASVPEPGKVFLDARGPERAMRVTWHHQADTVVLSLWQTDRCVSTFRLQASSVPDLVEALVEGLGAYVAPAAPSTSATA